MTDETNGSGAGEREVLSCDDREALWWTIATVRDGAARTVDDADTEDIIDAILDSGLLHRLTSAAATRTRAEERERIAQAIEADDTGSWTPEHFAAIARGGA